MDVTETLQIKPNNKPADNGDTLYSNCLPAVGKRTQDTKADNILRIILALKSARTSSSQSLGHTSMRVRKN